MYFINVMTGALNTGLISKKTKYNHFESIEGMFYNLCNKYTVSSTNGFAIDTNRLSDDYRITRFIRDPRDLVVSGYHYHKRGAEPWFRMKNPTLKYWSPINANVPTGISEGQSYEEYLSGISEEDGIMAEIEFRKFHFESMRQWKEDEKILLFKYEEIIGNEVEVYKRIATHYELPNKESKKIIALANKLSLKNSKSKHIRNAKPNQWKDLFSDKSNEYFNSLYSDIIHQYGYTLNQ